LILKCYDLSYTFRIRKSVGLTVTNNYYILGVVKGSEELCAKIDSWKASSEEVEKPAWVNKLTLLFIFNKKDLKKEALVWLKSVFSLTGFWSLIPVLMGVGLVYYGHSQGSDTKTWKGTCEVIALWLMGATTFLFLIRTILFRTSLDIVLLALSASFLCREIHFVGTHQGIYVAIAVIGVWTWLWRDKLLEEVDGKKQLKVTMFCMCWSYFVAIVIQRRVFKEKRLPLLPNEELLHVPLEEVTENFSHAAFLLVGLVSFFFSKKKTEKEDSE
jgi:hypothetical protein